MFNDVNPRKALVIGALLPILYVADVPHEAPTGLTLMRQAHAIVGAPLTPVSVAGVARRSTYRAVAACYDRAAATGHGPATGGHRAAAGRRRPATAARSGASGRRTGDRRHRQFTARWLRTRNAQRCRIPEMRRRLLPRGVPGQQPGLRGAVAMAGAVHCIRSG
jgi:hypothetical protein